MRGNKEEQVLGEDFVDWVVWGMGRIREVGRRDCMRTCTCTLQNVHVQCMTYCREDKRGVLESMWSLVI